MARTIKFRVVKEPFGWAVRLDGGMMTAFCSRNEAVRHARGCAAALREHGELAEVVIEALPAPTPPSERKPARFHWF
jgi:hypothetical protein